MLPTRRAVPSGARPDLALWRGVIVRVTEPPAGQNLEPARDALPNVKGSAGTVDSDRECRILPLRSAFMCPIEREEINR
jgi:hypothetical protein